MTGRTRIIVTAAVAVVLLLLFFFFVVQPRRNELTQVRDEVTQAQARQVALQTELERLQDLQERAPELRAELDEIRDLIPPRNRIPNVIFEIEQASNRAGVDFLTITPELPEPPPEGAALGEIRLTLGAEGGYFAIQDFVRRLYNLERALRLDVINLASADEQARATASQVTFQGAVRIFFDLPEDLPPTEQVTTPLPGEATPAPAETESP